VNGNILNNAAPQGVQTSKAQGFSSPRSVRRLGSSDYLVADTGNNRVVRFDKGAVVRWSVSRFVDPYGVLAPGDPLTLDTPTDVLTRRLRTFDTADVLVGYEDHYIIADSGNSRVLDVVDYYDLNGQPRSPGAGLPSAGVVVWTTRTKSSSGQNLSYNKLQLLGSNIGGISGKPVLVASVSNTGVAAGNNDKASNSGNGSLVQLDYNPRNTAFVLVDATTGAFNSIGRYWSDTIPEPTNNGKPLLAINELRSYDPDGAGGITINTKPLNAPSYFEEIPLDIAPSLAGAEKVYLIADSDGVYLATINTVAATATQGAKSYFDVIWRFGQANYDAINAGRLTVPAGFVGKSPQLSAASVKRLANGDFLITNSAAESSALFQSGRFTGEVFEVKPINTILTGTNIDTNGKVIETVVGGTFGLFSAPRLIKGTGVLNKQQMGRDTNGATLTEQPRSADRL